MNYIMKTACSSECDKPCWRKNLKPFEIDKIVDFKKDLFCISREYKWGKLKTHES